MSEVLATILVKLKETGAEVVINETDFDAKLHVDVTGAVAQTTTDKEPATVSLTKAQIVTRLEELKVTFKPAASKADLEALLADEEAKLLAGKNEAAPALSVKAKDDKFVIVNEAGEQQGEVFATAEEAEIMLNMLSGK